MVVVALILIAFVKVVMLQFVVKTVKTILMHAGPAVPRLKLPIKVFATKSHLTKIQESILTPVLFQPNRGIYKTHFLMNGGLKLL
jgi:hypothetical protein